MLVLARLYDDESMAQAAAAALVDAGYSSSDVGVLEGPRAAVAASEDDDASAPAPASTDGVSNAVRVGSMLGQHADFYMPHLTEGRTLVVATPPFVGSARAESILEGHNPLPIHHVPPSEPFVPMSQRVAPFSEMLGLPVLAEGTLSQNMGFKTSQDGFSHFSRWFAPLSGKFSLSSKFGMSTSSNRLENKSSSFGIPLQTRSATPLSSMLGLSPLAKSKRFLTG